MDLMRLKRVPQHVVLASLKVQGSYIISRPGKSLENGDKVWKNGKKS